MAEDVVPAPDRSERAQARRVQHFQKMQIAVDGFGAFEMKHHRKRSALNRRTDLGGGLAKRHGALRLPDNPHQHRQLTGDGFACVVDGERIRKRHRITAARHLLAQRRKIAGRRRIHREQTADERAGFGLLQVDMAGVLAIQEIGHRVVGFGLVKAQQNIVVAVENGNVGGHCLPLPVTDIASVISRSILRRTGRCATSIAAKQSVGWVERSDTHHFLWLPRWVSQRAQPILRALRGK